VAEDGIDVVFGGGPLGLAVVETLTGRGRAVRLVTRSGRADIPGGVQVVAADVSDPERAAEAARGAAAIYHCVGADYGHWQQLLPSLMAGAMHAAEATGARIVYGDNLYAYGPVGAPLTEVLPSKATGANGRIRTELAIRLLDAHRAGRLRATIGRASDFYGPRVRLSTVGERVFGALLRGKPAELLGNPDLPHTVTVIYNFAEGLVTLGERDEALGEVWHVPSAETLSMRQFVGLVAAESGRPARVQVAPSRIIRFLSMFNPTLRAVAEQLYQSERSWVVDHAKFASAFGAHPTPHPEAIARTLDWYRAARSPKEGEV
jgi:nucleoside-diphosphate-sugar epimerase